MAGCHAFHAKTEMYHQSYQRTNTVQDGTPSVFRVTGTTRRLRRHGHKVYTVALPFTSCKTCLVSTITLL